MNKYKNMWADDCMIKRPEYYENNAPLVGSYRGVDVFKTHERGFDYVIGGACVTQRAGFDKKSFHSVVDGLLDGDGENLCSEKVAKHLRNLGFTPMTYDEACLKGK